MSTLPPITHPDSQVHAFDRLAFTLLMAVVVHFLLWAAFDLKLPEPKMKNDLSSSLRVTLVKVKAEELTEPVQHIAEQNQAASGLGEQDLEPQHATPPPASNTVSESKAAQPLPKKVETVEKNKPIAPHSAVVQRPVDEAKAQPQKLTKAEPKPSERPARVETPPEPVIEPTVAAVNTPAEVPPLPVIDANALLARSLEIARLEAEQQALEEQYAKRPKVRTLSTASAKAYDDAAYLRQWQEQVERVGNLNYPERVRAEKLSGRLRLMVALRPDGSVQEIQLLKSSGFTLLDQSAINIVKQAAPFAAFPRSIKERTDILEIIRTWQFGDGNLFGDAG